jgi:hypothetical protein
LDALDSLGQAPIDRSLLSLHPAPLIPVLLQVSPIVFEMLDPSGESPVHSGGPAGSDALDTPHVEGRNEEDEEARSEQVGANAVPMMYGVGDGRHDSGHAQKAAHDPRQEAAVVPRGTLFCSAGGGPVLPDGFGCHDHTIVICDGWRSKAQMETEWPAGCCR